MKAHHYRARLEKAILQYGSCTGSNDYRLLALVKQEWCGGGGWREVNKRIDDCAEMLASGEAIRVTVTGPSALSVYVDPK